MFFGSCFGQKPIKRAVACSSATALTLSAILGLILRQVLVVFPMRGLNMRPYVGDAGQHFRLGNIALNIAAVSANIVVQGDTAKETQGNEAGVPGLCTQP